MPQRQPCALCATLPGTLRPKQRALLCVCGFALQFHTLGHPHGFSGGTPGCQGFQERGLASDIPPEDVRQLSLLPAPAAVG